jgi:hypothetical protein
MSKTISTKVNELNLLQVLKLAFSHDAVIGELIQNARRAGATMVSLTFDGTDLVVTDDGEGIKDLGKLLSVAESGWDAQTCADERPFGMGFLSTIYAAEAVTVTTSTIGGLGETFTATQKEILAMAPLHVHARDGLAKGTTLTLHRFDVPGCDREQVQQSKLIETLGFIVKRTAMGFSIPVIFNGEEISRPDALTDRFVKTAIGIVKLALGTERYQAYVQGLPIENRSYRHRPDSIVHVNNDVGVKLPDRKHFIDDRAIDLQIKDSLRQAARAELSRLKSVMPADTFVTKHYDHCRLWRCLDLLNDLDVVPGSLFVDWTNSEPGYESDGNERNTLAHPVSKADILAKGVFKLPDDDDAKGHCWLAKSSFFSYDARNLDDLHRDHWVWPLLQTLTVNNGEEHRIRIIANGLIGQRPYYPYGGCVSNVAIVESLEVEDRVTGIRLNVECVADDGTYYLTREGQPNLFVLDSYMEDSSYQDDEHDNDVSAVLQIRQEVLAGSHAEELHLAWNAMNQGRLREHFAGKTFRMVFDVRGVLTTVTEDSIST